MVLGMITQANIILIGPMGSGKSSVGKQLAEKLHRSFFDSDIEIEKSTGVKIPLIFELEGENGFRKRETQTLKKLVRKKQIILATGGGAIIREYNRQLLQNNGIIVYLLTSIDTILERTKWDQNRPLLQTENPRLKLESLMKSRAPLYENLAQLTVATDNRTLQEVVESIIDNLT